MAVLAVTSDTPSAGKTAFCAALTHYVRGNGKKAAVHKPVEPAEDADIAAYRKLLGQGMNGAGRLPEDAARENDLLLVEVPSWMSNQDSIRLVEDLDANVVGIVGYRPDLEAQDVTSMQETYGGRLLGVVINGRTRYKGRDVTRRLLPSVEQTGVSVLGVIPEDRTLLGVTVSEIAAHLDGRIITDEGDAKGLVEHFLVGGLGLDKGIEYFEIRERKAAVVRGDRPDIQMAALQTPTACLLLTKGIPPIEYVLYEAEEQEIPIVLVEPDTIPVMESLATIQDRSRFDHPDKLARFGQLLTEHADLDAILKAAGLTQQP